MRYRERGDKTIGHPSLPVQVNVLHADRFHALQEEYGGKAAASNLVVHVSVGFLDADRRQPLGQIRIAEIPALPLGPEADRPPGGRRAWCACKGSQPDGGVSVRSRRRLMRLSSADKRSIRASREARASASKACSRRKVASIRSIVVSRSPCSVQSLRCERCAHRCGAGISG